MPAVKLPPANAFLEAMEVRRTQYALSKKIPVSDARIQEIIKHVMLHVPSAFNSQTTRIVYLAGKEHDKLWDIVYEVLKDVVSADRFEPTARKITGFKAGSGTVSQFLHFPPVPSPPSSHPSPLFLPQVTELLH